MYSGKQKFKSTWLILDSGSDCHVAGPLAKYLGCIMDIKAEKNLTAADEQQLIIEQVNNTEFFSHLLCK